MTIQQIKNFIIIVDTGSFTKAEDLTFLSKQALKKQIDSLEDELQFRLITRNSKGIYLTEAGETFYNASVKSMKALDSLINECRTISHKIEQLNIGNPSHPKLLLGKVFLEFARRYPGVHQNILVVTKDVSQMVLNGQLDLAEFVYRPELIPEGILYKCITDLHYSCIMLASHPLADRELITIPDLIPYELGITATKHNEMLDLLQTYPQAVIKKYSDSSFRTIENVCYNQGIFLTKSYYSDQFTPLISRTLETDLKFECGVIYRENPSRAVQNFLDLIDEIFSADDSSQ